MTQFVLLAIDFGDLVGVLIFVTIAVLSVLNQFIVKWREQAAKRQGPPRQGQPRPAQKPPGKDPSKEVEEFLRRVAQMGRDEEPQPAPREINVEVVEPPRRRPQRPATAPPPQRPPRPKKPKQPPQPSERLRERRLESQVAGRHVSSRVEQADERVEAQVHQHLDHMRSSIPADQADKPSTLLTTAPAGGQFGPAPQLDRAAMGGASLAALLANAKSIRQAIVLNEVLRRPEERWE